MHVAPQKKSEIMQWNESQEAQLGGSDVLPSDILLEETKKLEDWSLIWVHFLFCVSKNVFRI